MKTAGMSCASIAPIETIYLVIESARKPVLAGEIGFQNNQSLVLRYKCNKSRIVQWQSDMIDL
jgi:hypothetical protein